MKIKVFLFLIIVGFLLARCSIFDDEVVYSCDPDINKIVNANIAVYKNLDRAEWKKLAPEMKIPVYRTFSSEKKRLFWKSKYKELQNLKWTEAEKAHIDLLYSLLEKQPDLFDQNTLKDQRKMVSFTVFCYNWNQYAVDSLKWDKKFVYAVSASGAEIKSSEVAYWDNDSSNTCGCSQKSDWCDIAGELYGVSACRSHPCEKTNDGCGTLWRFSCDGICKNAYD